MIALSTAWIPEDGWPIERVLDAFETFDLDGVEFNYRVHPLDLEATRRELRKREITVTSLHNICSTNELPLANDDRYGDGIASLDEGTRQTAATYLKETAQVARSLGARAIVVHSGEVDAIKQFPAYREAMKQARRENNPEILKEHLPALSEMRSVTAPQHVAQLVRSLREVCPLFPDIRFGLEIRYHFHDVPDFDELETVLAEVNSDNVGYWHDCGHAQVQENLGIRCHEDWLKRYQDRLIGVHLHGMQNLILDHRAPTEGNMDFAMIRRYTNPGTLLTMEVSAENSTEAVLAGKCYLERVFEN